MSHADDPLALPSTILVVDDDADSRMMLSSALRSEGLNPVPAADGGTALVLMRGMVPDLVLLDAVMPPPDGFETCRRIKANADWAHVPVVFMTGLTETEHVIEGLRSGGVDYVTKPIVLDELLARIRVHLANARMTRSAQTALDAAGRSLIATDAQGRYRWATPQAQQLLALIADPEAIALRTGQMIGAALSGSDNPLMRFSAGHLQVELAYVGHMGEGDHFFRIIQLREGMETMVLQKAFGLTSRESEVLFWIAQGKSNRDASEILNISARTVNKHLEQIFVKLGVENRSAATAIAIRAISSMM